MYLRSFVAAVVTLSASLAAHADTLSLGSYGTGTTAPGSVVNSSVTYGASGATYDISPNGVWAGPLSNSSWVSFNPGTSPTSSGNPTYVAPNGTYTYSTTFTATDATSGSITVLADDTTDILLNGNIVASAGSGQAAHCTVTVPNCLEPVTFALDGSYFVDGLNTLTFNVDQDWHNGTGLDFTGSVQTGVTPEPSSFLLLGTGLLGAAGVLRKRMAA